MKKIQLAFGVLLLLLFSSAITLANAEVAERSTSFTTSKGTIVNVNATIEHDGLTSDSSKPILKSNNTYVLSITVTTPTLGADVLDIHIEAAHAHTGGMPVGIQQFCYAQRRKTVRIFSDNRVEYREDPKWFTPYYRRDTIA